MPDWIIYILLAAGALQTWRILETVVRLLAAWRRKIEIQTEAMEATIEYQNILWLTAMEKETMPPSFGKN